MGSNRYQVAKSQSEDCLYLNIWTRPLKHTLDAPAEVEEEVETDAEDVIETDPPLRPVLVEIHGGSYLSGSGDALAYDGSVLAAKGEFFFLFFFPL